MRRPLLPLVLVLLGCSSPGEPETADTSYTPSRDPSQTGEGGAPEVSTTGGGSGTGGAAGMVSTAGLGGIGGRQDLTPVAGLGGMHVGGSPSAAGAGGAEPFCCSGLYNAIGQCITTGTACAGQGGMGGVEPRECIPEFSQVVCNQDGFGNETCWRVCLQAWCVVENGVCVPG